MAITLDLKESDHLVIAFAGANGKMGDRDQNFFKSAGFEDVSTVHVNDPHKICTLAGVPPEYPNFHDLTHALEEIVDRHPHENLIVVGASGGGLPALLYGHILKADHAVIFSGYTCVDPDGILQGDDQLLATVKNRIEMHPQVIEEIKHFMDSRNLLKKWNGKTTYDLHVSRFNKIDLRRARQLRGFEGVNIHTHPYSEHGLISMLIRNGRIRECFEFPYKHRRTLNDSIRYLRMYLRKLKGRL